MGVVLKSSRLNWRRGLGLAATILAGMLLIIGGLLNMFYIQKHSYTDFECEFFTQEIYMKYNLTTGNYELSLYDY